MSQAIIGGELRRAVIEIGELSSSRIVLIADKPDVIATSLGYNVRVIVTAAFD